MAYRKSNSYTIYAYIAPDGRRYIGKTGAQRNARAGNGGSGYKHCGCFWKAINRFGWGSFQYEILAVIPKDEPDAAQKACDAEARFIMQYRTTDIKFGFNRCKKDSPRTYSKLSQSRKNRRVIHKDGTIRHIPEAEFTKYLDKGWIPGYKGTS